MTEVSTTENWLCELMRRLLDQYAVGEQIRFAPTEPFLTILQLFLPGLLREIHSEWRYESLDGIYPSRFWISGEREVAIQGLALFISDQTLTPLNVRLQLSRTCDRMAWVELKLGERIDFGCRRTPMESSKTVATMIHAVDNGDDIDWFYHVGIGEKESLV